MYLYNTWEETGDESVECRALRKFLRQIELHKTGQVYKLLVYSLGPDSSVYPLSVLRAQATSFDHLSKCHFSTCYVSGREAV